MPECSDTLEKWKKFYYDCLSSEDLITSFIAKKKKKEIDTLDAFKNRLEK